MSNTTFPITFDAAFAPATLSTQVEVTDADRDAQLARLDADGRDRYILKEGQSGVRLLTFE